MRVPARIVFTLVVAMVCMPVATHAATPDYSAWQAVLQKYARQISPKGQPIETRFDYEQFYVDENIWSTRTSPTLARIREQLFATTPDQLSDTDRKAWALNAYNFLVVERATLKLLVPNRRFFRHRSVNEMQFSDGGFFNAKVVTLGGHAYSIGEFERAFVHGDPIAPPDPRSVPADPRLGFAICPGAVGGPTLWLRAFRGDSLEAQLERVTRNAMASPTWVSVGAQKDDLVVSDALFSRRIDLGGDAAGILRFIEKYGTSDAKAVIKKYRLTSVPRFKAFDWALNQTERPKGSAPLGLPADSTRNRQ